MVRKSRSRLRTLKNRAGILDGTAISSRTTARSGTWIFRGTWALVAEKRVSRIPSCCSCACLGLARPFIANSIATIHPRGNRRSLPKVHGFGLSHPHCRGGDQKTGCFERRSRPKHPVFWHHLHALVPASRANSRHFQKQSTSWKPMRRSQAIWSSTPAHRLEGSSSATVDPIAR